MRVFHRLLFGVVLVAGLAQSLPFQPLSAQSAVVKRGPPADPNANAKQVIGNASSRVSNTIAANRAAGKWNVLSGVPTAVGQGISDYFKHAQATGAAAASGAKQGYHNGK
jgi:hypothetical protein